MLRILWMLFDFTTSLAMILILPLVAYNLGFYSGIGSLGNAGFSLFTTIIGFLALSLDLYCAEAGRSEWFTIVNKHLQNLFHN